MSELPDDLFAGFENVANEAQNLAFIARDTGLQQEAVKAIDAFLQVLAAKKDLEVGQGNELSANTVLSMELALLTVRSHLQMCVLLKQGAAEEAWNRLIDAEQACDAAISVRRQLQKDFELTGLQNLRATLQQIEDVVFPSQLFFSVGGTVDSRECSICGGEYDDCGHVKGRAYFGKSCHTLLRHVDLEEVSIVTNPANKRARVTHFSDEGKMRNRMTWRLEERSSPPPPLPSQD